MPVYAYECSSCGVYFERRQGFDDKPIKVCPECEGSVRRLIQLSGVIFKGSGFYSTDHKSSSHARSSDTPQTEKANGEGAAAKTESKSDSKSESKPASKSAGKNEKAAVTASE